MTISRNTLIQPLRLAILTALFAGSFAHGADNWDMPNTHPTDVAPVRFSQVSAGSNHSLGLSKDGTVWAWGNNSRRQVGVPGMSQSERPARVLGGLLGKAVRSVVAAGDHSLALTEEGEVYAWGSTQFSFLGPAAGAPATPSRVEGALHGQKVVMIGARDYANYAVTEAGELFEWRRDNVDASGANLAQPVAILPGRRVVNVVGGTDFAFAIDDSGALWGWGTGIGPNGEIGTFEAPEQPVRVVALRDKVITTVAAGGAHALAGTAEGEVFAWGNNYWGQLGTGRTGTETSSELPVALSSNLFIDKVVTLSASRNTSYALTEHGQLYAWGINTTYQLPLPLPPSDAGGAVNVPTHAQASVVRGGIASVDGGYKHGLALARDGSVLAWGVNTSGQVGFGLPADDKYYPPRRAEPVTAPVNLLMPTPASEVRITYPTWDVDTLKPLPTFYGTGAPGTALSVLVAGSTSGALGTTLCTATINSSGYWNCAPSTALGPNAVYTVRAFAFVDGYPVPPNDVSFVTAP